MYDTKLARKILEKLDDVFPDKLHLLELREALQEYEQVPLDVWLSAVQALRLEHKLQGEFLSEGTSIADAAALYITDLGRSDLQAASSPSVNDRNLKALGLMTEPSEQFQENIRFIQQAEQANPELRRKRERQEADLNAVYARHLGRNGPEVERQEHLLKDARVWAREESRKIIADGVRDVQELKARVVKQTWDEFVRAHAYYSDLRLGYRQFASVLWDEEWPSLNDSATVAIQERAAANAPRSVRVSPSKAGRAAWAACPRAADAHSSEPPRPFKTERGARRFLNTKIRHSAGGRFNFARSDKGWLALPISSGVITGSKPARTFQEFLPTTAVAVSDPPTMEGLLQRVLDDRLAEPSCSLGEEWRFADIERDAWKRVGHAYEGRKHTSVDELVVKAVHDLENSLFAVHPNAGTASVASFFGSWQVWRHVSDFCEQISKSPAVRRLDGAPEHARDRVYEQCWVYAHEVSAGAQVNDIVPKPSPKTRAAHSVGVPAESARDSSASEASSRPLPGEPLLPAVLNNGPANRNTQPSAERTIRKYEEGGHLLAQRALENLRSRSGRREKKIADQLASATARLQERREELGRASGGRQDIGAVLHQQGSALCMEIVGVAATEAADGVREFADGLLLSQNRLGVHANLLREYTGILVSEVRKVLNASEVFQVEPLLPWGQDSISQKAIQTCEEIIAGRRKAGDRWEYDTENVESAPGHWPPIVQQWEGFKEAHRIEPSPDCERIPESALRAILGGSYGIAAQEVAWEQIRLAGADLCRHYGPFLLLPTETGNPPERVPDSTADAKFWREREDEFRKHGTGDNGTVVALWFSAGDQWRFRAGSGAESSRQRPESVFKSLAREATKGLACPQSNEQWVEWLNALRRTKYAKLSSTGSHTISERELERMQASGENIPAGGMIRFVPAPKGTDSGDGATAPSRTGIGGVETQRAWDTTTITIEDVFNSSADFCLELRSRVTSHAGPIQTGRPARHEIKSLADDTFSVTRDRLITEHAEKKNQILGQVARTGNSGGHLPALTKWACESLRETILALADAYVEAFTLFGVPADVQAEKDIEASAKQMAAGSISGVSGELSLIATRTNRPAGHSGGHLNREIDASMLSALKEGRLRLKRQRIEVNNSASPAPRRPTPPEPGRAEHSTREAGPSSDRTLTGTMADLQELPSKFQNRFETAKAKAELEYANRSETSPHHPQFAEHPVNYILLIQKVFFAYCEEARNACREDVWSVVKARQATEAALPLICDHYFVRKHGDRAEEKKSAFRSLFAEGVFLDPKGKQHLSELVTLAEGAATGPPIKTGRNEDHTRPTTADVPGTPTTERDVEATPTLTPDATGKAIPVRAELLRAFKAKGRTQGVKITDPMVAHAADPKWNDRTMVTWWKRNDDRCKPPHDKKIRAVLGKEPSTIWPKTS